MKNNRKTFIPLRRRIMHIKIKINSAIKTEICRKFLPVLNNQKGALLIALIVTMVIISALAGGIVYIFSSANLNPISGNYAQRAYYNAEAGFRYVISQYRATGDEDIFNSTYHTEQTINLPEGGTARVTTETVFKETFSATLTVNTKTDGSKQYVVNNTTGFPLKNGFFKDSGGKVRHYLKLGEDTHPNTGAAVDVLVGVSPVSGLVNGNITGLPDGQTVITSKGSFPNDGFWSVSRTVKYKWPLSGEPTGGPPTGAKPVPTPTTTAFDVDDWDIFAKDLVSYLGLGSILQAYANVGLPMKTNDICDSWGYFDWHSGQSAIHVTSLDRFFLAYDYDFYNLRQVSPNNTVSYDAQAKIRIGDGNNYSANNYFAGLSFRAHDGGLCAVDQFGVSYAKGHNWKFRLPTDNDIYIVFWRSVSDHFKLIAYKKIGSGEGIGQTIFFEDDMEYAVGETPTAWEVKSIDGSASDAWTMTSASSYSPSHSWKGEPYYTDPGKLVLNPHYATGLSDFVFPNRSYAEIFLCKSNDQCTSIEKWDDSFLSETAQITIPPAFKPSTGSYLKFYLYGAAGWSPYWWINSVNIYGVFSDDMQDFTQWPTHDNWTAGIDFVGFQWMRSGPSSATLISIPFDIPSIVADKRHESLISPAFNTTGAGITDSSEIQLTFKHKLQIYDGDAYVEVCQGNNCGAGGAWTEIKHYGGDIDDWTTAGPVSNPISLPSAYVNKTNVRIRFRLTTTREDKFPVWYIDDVKVATPNKLVDWATLLVRLKEKVSPTRRNEFEIFYGHPTGNNGTGPSTVAVVDINRSNNARDSINWPPASPIKSISLSADKFTLVSSDSSDPYASANPWYWWYDSDGNYTNSGGVATLAAGNTRTEENGCSYTLETGGTLEPYAVIKTTGSNCLTTDSYSYNANTDDFGLHVYSGWSGVLGDFATWFDDIAIQLTGGYAPYIPPIQY